MRKLLVKELKLTASPLSYLFIAFALLTFCPGYPILVGGFFVSLGIFQSFQSGRENHDILYTALLPVRKKDVVLAKFAFTVAIQMMAFALITLVTLIRMIWLSEAPAYVNNALMSANFISLGFALVLFGFFQLCFLCGFFRTAYNFGRAFVGFTVCGFLTVMVGETLHHIPGLSYLNATGFTSLNTQIPVLALGIVFYVAATLISFRLCCKRFEQLDL